MLPDFSVINGRTGNLLTQLSLECLQDSRLWFPGANGSGPDLAHHALGMAGEAGEVANIVKKIDRGDFDLSDTTQRNRLAEENTDVLIYNLNIYALLHVDPLQVYRWKRAVNARRFAKERNSA